MEVHDTAYEITFDIPGLRKEDLTISVSNDALRSEWGSDASVSDSGKLLQIIGRTANANMDVGIARAVQLYSDADFDKGLNTTHADGRLTIRVARQTSATLPLWSTWQLQGHLPERIVWSSFPKRVYHADYPYLDKYDVRFSKAKSTNRVYHGDYLVDKYDVRFSEARLKDVDYEYGRCKQWFCRFPSLQWLTQAPIQALKFWFATPNAGELIANLPMKLLFDKRGSYYQASRSFEVVKRGAYMGFRDSGSALYRLDDKEHGAIIDIFMSINETISKAVSHIEDSGGYTITLKPNANYAIKNGVLSWQPHAKKTGYFNMDNFNLRLFGTWWSKDVKVTRQDGLDVIFIPISSPPPRPS